MYLLNSCPLVSKLLVMPVRWRYPDPEEALSDSGGMEGALLSFARSCERCGILETLCWYESSRLHAAKLAHCSGIWRVRT